MNWPERDLCQLSEWHLKVCRLLDAKSLTLPKQDKYVYIIFFITFCYLHLNLRNRKLTEVHKKYAIANSLSLSVQDHRATLSISFLPLCLEFSSPPGNSKCKMKLRCETLASYTDTELLFSSRKLFLPSTLDATRVGKAKKYSFRYQQG